MENSFRICYVSLKGLDVADRAKVEELVFYASATPSYDMRRDEYKVITSAPYPI